LNGGSIEAAGMRGSRFEGRTICSAHSVAKKGRRARRKDSGNQISSGKGRSRKLVVLNMNPR